MIIFDIAILFFAILIPIFLVLVCTYLYIYFKEEKEKYHFCAKESKEKEHGMKLNVIQFILWVAYISVGVIDRNVLCCVLGGAGIAICVYDFILERKARGK